MNIPIKVVGSSTETMNLKFSNEGLPEGNFRAYVPVAINMYPHGQVAEQLVQVDVTSSTSKNSKGAVSGVIKVSMPYTGLSVPEGANVPMKDSKRSGGVLSAHVVYTMPSAMVQDLTSSTNVLGSAATQNYQAVALAQMAFVNALLQSVTGGFNATDILRKESDGVKTQPVCGFAYNEATGAYDREVVAGAQIVARRNDTPNSPFNGELMAIVGYQMNEALKGQSGLLPTVTRLAQNRAALSRDAESIIAVRKLAE